MFSYNVFLKKKIIQYECYDTLSGLYRNALHKLYQDRGIFYVEQKDFCTHAILQYSASYEHNAQTCVKKCVILIQKPLHLFRCQGFKFSENSKVRWIALNWGGVRLQS